MQKLRRLALLDTNITPLLNNKMHPAGSFPRTFQPCAIILVIVIIGDWQICTANIFEPTQTGINPKLHYEIQIGMPDAGMPMPAALASMPMPTYGKIEESIAQLLA